LAGEAGRGGAAHPRGPARGSERAGDSLVMVATLTAASGYSKTSIEGERAEGGEALHPWPATAGRTSHRNMFEGNPHFSRVLPVSPESGSLANAP